MKSTLAIQHWGTALKMVSGNWEGGVHCIEETGSPQVYQSEHRDLVQEVEHWSSRLKSTQGREERWIWQSKEGILEQGEVKTLLPRPPPWGRRGYQGIGAAYRRLNIWVTLLPSYTVNLISRQSDGKVFKVYIQCKPQLWRGKIINWADFEISQ